MVRSCGRWSRITRRHSAPQGRGFHTTSVRGKSLLDIDLPWRCWPHAGSENGGD